jgi:hypothetical protein
MAAVSFLTNAELEAGLATIRAAPKDSGVLELIVRRPKVNERELLEEGWLNPAEGLAGDTWKDRTSSRTVDGSPHPDMQLNIMSARTIRLLSPEKDRWPLAGDQLFIDLDLSRDNLPPGTRLAIGSAVIVITSQPHTGCSKFAARFGPDALAFVNSDVGKDLQLRGLNARVVQPGAIRVGDIVRKA